MIIVIRNHGSLDIVIGKNLTLAIFESELLLLRESRCYSLVDGMRNQSVYKPDQNVKNPPHTSPTFGFGAIEVVIWIIGLPVFGSFE